VVNISSLCGTEDVGIDPYVLIEPYVDDSNTSANIEETDVVTSDVIETDLEELHSSDNTVIPLTESNLNSQFLPCFPSTDAGEIDDSQHLGTSGSSADSIEGESKWWQSYQLTKQKVLSQDEKRVTELFHTLESFRKFQMEDAEIRMLFEIVQDGGGNTFRGAVTRLGAFRGAVTRSDVNVIRGAVTRLDEESDSLEGRAKESSDSFEGKASESNSVNGDELSGDSHESSAVESNSESDELLESRAKRENSVDIDELDDNAIGFISECICEEKAKPWQLQKKSVCSTEQVAHSGRQVYQPSYKRHRREAAEISSGIDLNLSPELPCIRLPCKQSNYIVGKDKLFPVPLVQRKGVQTILYQGKEIDPCSTLTFANNNRSNMCTPSGQEYQPERLILTDAILRRIRCRLLVEKDILYYIRSISRSVIDLDYQG